MAKCTLPLPVPQPFELRLALFGHGWIDLAPHRFDEGRSAWHTVLRCGGALADAVVTQPAAAALRVELATARRLPAAAQRAALQQLGHMLRLGEDFAPLHARCAAVPRLRWVAQRGAGRLLRSPGVFEDLLKLLFTTNTSWAGTRAMVRQLVAACGPPAPSGARAFPTPAECPVEAGFWRDTVRAGYRAAAAVELVQAFRGGALDDAAFLAPQPSEALWRRLLDLRGFGPYAAGQAMRLCGHYAPLALDSWCRAQLAAQAKRRRPPTDAAVARRYAPFAPFQGLALWLDLTAAWHGEDAAAAAPFTPAVRRAPP